jgi:hypothetical protein
VAEKNAQGGESRKVSFREGYKGKPLPAGAKPSPPPGPAADVPAKPQQEGKPTK